MKILLTLFVLLLLFSAKAEEGDVYYCETTNVVKSKTKGSEEFGNFNFKFKRNINKIIFNESDNYFNDYDMEVIFSYDEFFRASNEFDVLLYRNNIFLYSSNNLEDDINDAHIISIIAKCDLF